MKFPTVAVTNGWYPICWAFLKPGDGKTFTNIDVRCSLQLYYYQRHRPKRGIFDEWKAQKRMYVDISNRTFILSLCYRSGCIDLFLFLFVFERKYPAYLSVTVGSYQPETTHSISLTRPMSVLEEEMTGDIYTCASEGDDGIEEPIETANSTAKQNQSQNTRENMNKSVLKVKYETRLPGQVNSSDFIDWHILRYIQRY